MRIVWVITITLMLGFAPATITAQKPSIPNTNANTAKWPVCNLGGAPLDKSTPPPGAVVFPAEGGPVLMSERGKGTEGKFITCLLRAGEPIYRATSGVLYDVASNQPFFPIRWDEEPPPPPQKGEPGAPGPQGPRGEPGAEGPRGPQGPQGVTVVPSSGWDLDWGLTGALYAAAVPAGLASGVVRSISDVEACELKPSVMGDVGLFLNFNEWLGVRGLATLKALRGTTQFVCPNGCVASVQEADGLRAWGGRADLMLTVPLTELIGLRGTFGIQGERYTGRTIQYVPGTAGITREAGVFLGMDGSLYPVIGIEVPIQFWENLSLAPAWSYGFPQGSSIGVRLDKKF